MIEADPVGYLAKRFHLREHLKTIVDPKNGASLKIKTFDMRVMTGTKPVAVPFLENRQLNVAQSDRRALRRTYHAYRGEDALLRRP